MTTASCRAGPLLLTATWAALVGGRARASQRKRSTQAVGFTLTPDKTAQICGCPTANVEQHWPGILTALQECGLTDRASIIAALATIGTEVRDFLPINEFGDNAHFTARLQGAFACHGEAGLPCNGPSTPARAGKPLRVLLTRAFDGATAVRERSAT